MLAEPRSPAEPSPEGLVLTDADGMILAVDGRLLALSGHAEDALLGTPIDTLVPSLPGSDRADHHHPLEGAPAVGVTFLDTTCRRADGTEFPARIALSRLQLDGQALVAAAVHPDSERASAERARREGEHKDLDLLLDAVRGYAIFTLDSEGRVATWNASAERLQGHRAEEILGQPLSVFYPAEAVAAGMPGQLIELARSAGRAEDAGWRVRRDGTRFRAAVTVTRLADRSGSRHGFATIVRDITEELQAREQRERLRLLEERERIARDLHDGVIQSIFTLGMHLQVVQALTKSDGEVADRLQSSIDQLDEIIKRLREYVFGLHRQPGFQVMRRGIQQLSQNLVERAGVTVSLSIDDGALMEFEPHANELLPLLREVLSNVAWHSDAKSCRISVRNTERAALLELDDDGRGFDVASTPLGFGLVDARERARRMGADCEIASGPGGTTVRLHLAREPTPRSDGESGTPPPHRRAASRAGRRGRHSPAR